MAQNDALAKVDELNSLLSTMIDKDSKWNRITTRAATQKTPIEFHTFNKGKLEKIAGDMVEINRAVRAFGRKNTQTTNKLMTLTMLSDTSPYRVLRQCLSQIETKRSAIKQNRYKIMKKRARIQEYSERVQLLQMKLKALQEQNTKDTLERVSFESQILSVKSEIEQKNIKIEEEMSNVSDSMLYIEGALKDIASFQSAYQQICKNKNIPENWDEGDMEEAEVRSHVRMAFLLAYRDVLANGRLGMGTLEYLQQFGINPIEAGTLVQSYLAQDKDPSYDSLEDFLDEMSVKFKDNYKLVLERMGIDHLYDEWCMYKNKEQN